MQLLGLLSGGESWGNVVQAWAHPGLSECNVQCGMTATDCVAMAKVTERMDPKHSYPESKACWVMDVFTGSNMVLISQNV